MVYSHNFSCLKFRQTGRKFKPDIIFFILKWSQILHRVSGGVVGINLKSPGRDGTWLKLLFFPYADDTFIFTDNQHGFQIVLRLLMIIVNSGSLEVNKKDENISIWSEKFKQYSLH